MPTIIEDDPMGPKPRCQHPEHEPPKHIVVPKGKRMVHTCPGCGEVTTTSCTGGAQLISRSRGVPSIPAGLF